MGFNLRSLSPLLTGAVLVWALLQPLRAEPTVAPRLALVSCDRGTAAHAEQWASAEASPQVSNTSLNPGIVLQ